MGFRGLEAPLGQLVGGLVSLAQLLGSPSAVMPRCSFVCLEELTPSTETCFEVI